MKKVILMKGLPGSGKTTWTKELMAKEPGKWKRINKDDLRLMLDNGKWSKGNEQFVLLMRDTMALSALEKGWSVIIDDTNLHPKRIQHMEELAKEAKAEFEIKDFTCVSLEECIKRDQKRVNYVGEKVIRDMYNQFLKPQPPAMIHDPALPNAWIFDIDGTLAIMKDRGPFDWSKIENDELNNPVAEIVRVLVKNYIIIIVSGRDGICEEETKRWLLKHDISYTHFFIRPIGNGEKDTVIKKRIYEESIKGKFNIVGVVDDRKQVKRMWVQEGLFVFDVNQEDIDF